MIEVPVPVKSWTHNFEVVHDIERVGDLLLWLLALLLLVGRLLQQEAIEAAVTCGNHVAYLHLFRERP